MAEGTAESQDQIIGPGTQSRMAKFLEDHFDKLSGSVKTLAQAVQTLRSDVNELKRKGQPTQNDEASSPKQRKTTVQVYDDETPSASGTQTGPTTISKDDHVISDNSDDEEDIDAIMEQDEQEDEDDIDLLADLENFFEDNDETGPEVGERMAKVTDKALRGKMTKEDEKKLEALKEKTQKAKQHKKYADPYD